MAERLFVYGTLRPGESNQHYLASIPGKWMNASLRGIHYPNGYGATEGYPVLTPTDLGQPIEGMVLEADFSAAQWQLLDDFETDAYERIRTTVVGEDGAVFTAFVYVLNKTDLAQLASELPELGLGHLS